MSSEPPPNPITNTFNLRDWIQAATSSSGAYLSKLFADTAAGVITFTSGIKTNLVDGAGTASTQVKIFPNSTDAIIDIGPAFGFAGQSSLIRFGPGGACNVTMGQLNSILTAQIIDSFSSGTASLYNTQTVPINMGSTSTAIQIGASQANTNTVRIGNTGSIVTIPGAATLGSINCASISSTTAGTAMNIASAAAEDRNVNILNGAYTGTQVKGNINIMTGSCGAATTAGTVAIQTNNTSGVCNIGNPNSRLTVACPLQVLTGNDSNSNVNVLSGAFTAGATAGAVSILSGSHNATATGGDINIHSGSCKGIMTLGNSVSTLNLSAGTINLNKPLKPTYSLTFTSDQIGYSSSSSISGVLVSSTYNSLLMPTLTGVYMISLFSYVTSSGFTGVHTYDFQVGLNGVGTTTRSYLAGTNLNYDNNQQSLPYVYSSSGPTNTGSALLYGSIFLGFTGVAGSPIWGMTLYYTRVA